MLGRRDGRAVAISAWHTEHEILFFFQAEDGIRDYKVTGVQTCALPIWLRRRDGAAGCEAGRRGARRTFRIPAAAYPGMRFARTQKEDPEINLIPMIDVLLVIIIFLMLTTTYSRFAELKINLPSADAERKPERSNEINVVISANGQYVLQRKPVQFRDVATLAEELRRAGAGMKEAIVVVNADNNANYQSVIRVMDAARQAGFGQIGRASCRERV